MPLLCNIHELEKNPLILRGELPIPELELEELDEQIRLSNAVEYDLQTQLIDRNILLKGYLRVNLNCGCVRCLEPFDRELVLKDWTCLLSLDGEERVRLIGDFVDLTPYIREDILLALPQHPLCEPECSGMKFVSQDSAKQGNNEGQTEPLSPAWVELKRLKL
ncbi:MAG: DUF177 domain-containing protein [Verrucomicrobiota bacterium]